MIHIPRLPWDAFFMLQAHLAATRSTCDRGPELFFNPGRHGVGAVLVRDHRIIAGGYNGSAPGQPHCDQLLCAKCGVDWAKEDLRPREITDFMCPKCSSLLEGDHLMRDGHCVRTIHSEMNALLQCALDGTSPQGSVLYTTASPCFDCAKSILRAGIVRVVFGQPYDSRYGLSGDVAELLKGSQIEVIKLEIELHENTVRIKPL